jgi:hypothetical protein
MRGNSRSGTAIDGKDRAFYETGVICHDFFGFTLSICPGEFLLFEEAETGARHSTHWHQEVNDYPLL